MNNIKKITVIGLGLIGGSLSMALKSLEEDFIITGYDIEGEAMNIAKYRNIIDNAVSDYREAVIDADLIIICTPISKTAGVINSIKDQSILDTSPTSLYTADINVSFYICR